MTDINGGIDPLDVARAAPVVPVIKLESVDQGLRLAGALKKGGLPVMEITLRSDVGVEAIAAVREKEPDILVGAGTVTNADELARVVDAGAAFVVTPGTTAELYAAAANSGIALIPGIQTASDIAAARAAGYRFLKFFPAGPAGGVAMLKAFGGPFQDVCFCPTGGIGPDNMAQYLRLPNVICVGGSWVAPGDLMRAGRFDAVTELAAAAASAGREALGDP